MSSNKIKVAFLDRDGVINEEVNYLHEIEKFKYTYRFKEGVKRLKSLGYEIVIVTNQAGIAKGIFSQENYSELTSWYIKDLERDNIDILDVYYCPHHPNGILPELSYDCICRKPKPGMLLMAEKEHNIDLKESILIGDKISDAKAGVNANLKHVFLVSTGHYIDRNEWDEPIYDSILEVAGLLS
ncbi:D-glycero-alpha-D-manno-heptose-1,7-bisphosphate 7-phosphatase [Vibrio vulnificus]|uniref:D-glycero-alpha-D-manno-heptose-1,7-bisphosphate 7-phosphatase n=1 Tax=Vibrio vulnificus TaxID=672 RepID=UPI001CDBEF7F|nr:HAD family hydrolase [Vibrio vulnificus]MCA3950713.1 HAD family hydrolase [Vibrio vulnificus]